ncbi:MAG: transcription factor FapR [Bacillota bacterium]
MGRNPAGAGTNDLPLTRSERLRRLTEKLEANPFLTDEDLAEAFGVSIQTIRLDRMSLGIPELRERVKQVARRTYGRVKSLGSKDIVGDLIDIVIEERAISTLTATEDMAFERTGIVRGHFIFAQADSLAIALVDAPVALTGLANIKFKRPVRVGEKLIAKAQVLRRKGNKLVILVQTWVGQDLVFRGKFVVVAVNPASGGEEGEDE